MVCIVPCHPPRLISAPRRLIFLIQPLNLVDLVCIIPWYINLVISQQTNSTSVFRVLRMVRVFRVFKLGGR